MCLPRMPGRIRSWSIFATASGLAPFTIPLLILTMGPVSWELGFIREMIGERAALWTELLLGPGHLVGGLAVLERSVKSVINRSLNIQNHPDLSAGAAYLFSVVVAVLDIFPAGFRNAEGHVGVCFQPAR